MKFNNVEQIFCTVNFSMGTLLSLQPTFYPTEAEARGASPFYYGLVFATASLSKVLFSPISGSYAYKVGVKRGMCVGAITEGICGFSFAFLSFSRQLSYFIGFSCVLRFIEGFAGGFRGSLSYAVLMAIYPDKVIKIVLCAINHCVILSLKIRNIEFIEYIILARIHESNDVRLYYVWICHRYDIRKLRRNDIMRD